MITIEKDDWMQFGSLIFAIAFYILFTFCAMWLWNAYIPHIFHVAHINLKETIAIQCMILLLFTINPLSIYKLTYKPKQ